MRVVYLMSGTQGEKDHNGYKEGKGSDRNHLRLLLILIFLDLEIVR